MSGVKARRMQSPDAQLAVLRSVSVSLSRPLLVELRRCRDPTLRRQWAARSLAGTPDSCAAEKAKLAQRSRYNLDLKKLHFLSCVYDEGAQVE